MTTLTANTSKTQLDRAAGQFDAVVGLPPVTTELNSQYGVFCINPRKGGLRVLRLRGGKFRQVTVNTSL
jgi:hypothetical protein